MTPTHHRRPTLICEPAPEAVPMAVLRCLQLAHLDLYELAAVLRGEVDVPTTPPRRLDLLPWEVAWGCYVYAEQLLEAMDRNADPAAYDRSVRAMDRQLGQSRLMRYQHQLGELPKGRTVEMTSAEYFQIREADGTVSDRFHYTTHAELVLLMMRLRDENLKGRRTSH